MNRRQLLILVTLISLPAHSSLAAVVSNLNNFTAFPNRFVADVGNQSQFPLPLGGDNIIGPFTIGGVTITSSNAPFFSGLYFASGSTGGGGELNSVNIPGNDAGATFFNGPITGFPLTELDLNFSQPIFGFGTTFLHEISGQPQFFNASGPAVIRVFSGLNATGTLLGTITDNGGVNLLSFIGLLSDTANIQSAILTSTGPTGAFEVDAFGLSVAPGVTPSIPEPATLWLMAGAAIAVGMRARQLR